MIRIKITPKLMDCFRHKAHPVKISRQFIHTYLLTSFNIMLTFRHTDKPRLIHNLIGDGEGNQCPNVAYRLTIIIIQHYL